MVESITSGDILTEEKISNHFKVFAGPGAGKTHFLVENIKNIVINNDLIINSKSRKVACITYTNSAVSEIKDRLDDCLDYVEVSTIHGFIIENIIKPFQQTLKTIMKNDFEISIESKGIISSQIEGLNIFHGIEKERIYEYIKQNSSAFGGELSYSKNDMGKIQVKNEEFLKSIRNGLPYNPVFSSPPKIRQEHVKAIKEFTWDVVRKLTHDEILYFGYRILQTNPTALYSIRVKFPFIFVDEFQDTNPLQTLLIQLIGNKSTRIGVVGDIAQSIYSFQGATPSDFQSFRIDGTITEELSIQGNRRSTDNIVNFCNFLRQSDQNVIQKSIRQYPDDISKKRAESKPIHFVMSNEKSQEILDSILADDGVVLTRAWSAAFQFITDVDDSQKDLLKKIYNSYYVSPIQIREEITEKNNVTWVRAFRFILNFYESYQSGSFSDMISAFQLYYEFNIKSLTSKILFEISNLAKNTFFELSSHELTVDTIKKFNDIVQREEFMNLRYFFNSDGMINIPIFDDLEDQRRKELLCQIEWDTSMKLFTEVFTPNSKYMTVHQAKGLEWKSVFVSLTPIKNERITYSQIFNAPHISNENSEDEFVRILYVACSRAKEDLYINITDNCSEEEIENALLTFSEKSGMNINFAFI